LFAVSLIDVENFYRRLKWIEVKSIKSMRYKSGMVIAKY